MIGMATGRYSIMRGYTEDLYGDKLPNEDPIHTNILGAVTERRRVNFEPGASRVGTVRELVGRFSSGTDIEDGDRIKDEKTGEVFHVVSVYRGTNLVNKSDLIVDLSN